ncbi:MAG: sigma-70 family RNA polymerase sigma factor [Bacteroidetes bacterium]|nr:sigma-70 family RNA polymerase sigma factor [Bacteroidota bacterium]
MIGQLNAISNQPPDEELVKKIVTGDKHLFEIIIRRYNQRLYRIGMSILNNDIEVEEAMQTAYINAYEHLSRFEYRSRFGTWLTRIMLNQCYKARRDRMRSVNIPGDSQNFINMRTPENVIASKQLHEALQNAITQLPEKYRLVFVLREIEDLSVQETADVAGIQTTNVKVRLNRAKAMLRQTLNNQMKDSIYPFHLTRCDKIVDHVMTHISFLP